MNQYIVPVYEEKRYESREAHAFRWVCYPDGTECMQGGFSWSQGSHSGTVWRNLPVVHVDVNGREIKNV